ncbi:hypothetical protein [Maricurvus nonylphenolicus]
MTPYSYQHNAIFVTPSRYIAWEHWACTSSAWQDIFSGEDDDPRLITST